jgi:integrase/recombinase XerD
MIERVLDEANKAIELEGTLLGRSPCTIKKYKYIIHNFLIFNKKEVATITELDIREYIKSILYLKKARPNTVNLILAALRFYFLTCLRMGIVTLKNIKAGYILPVVLTPEEVITLIDATNSKRSRLIVGLLYGTGMRVGELCSLKVQDIEFSEGIGYIRGGKGMGGKDRLFVIPKRIKKDLERYCRKHKKEYVFYGRKDKLTVRAVESMVVRLKVKVNMQKKITPHTFRHTYATHLLNSGVDIRRIQELLGHARLQTTQIYTTVSPAEIMKTKSPLDSLRRIGGNEGNGE